MQTRGGATAPAAAGGGGGGGSGSSAGGSRSSVGREGGKAEGGGGGGGGVLSWSMMGREGGDVLALGPGTIGISGTSTPTIPPLPPIAPLPPHHTTTTTNANTRPPTPTTTAEYTLDDQSQAIEPAVQYVQKIKQRCDADTYKRFLEILSKYHSGGDVSDEVRFFPFFSFSLFFWHCFFLSPHLHLGATSLEFKS